MFEFVAVAMAVVRKYLSGIVEGYPHTLQTYSEWIGVQAKQRKALKAEVADGQKTEAVENENIIEAEAPSSYGVAACYAHSSAIASALKLRLESTPF